LTRCPCFECKQNASLPPPAPLSPHRHPRLGSIASHGVHPTADALCGGSDGKQTKSGAARETSPPSVDSSRQKRRFLHLFRPLSNCFLHSRSSLRHRRSIPSFSFRVSAAASRNGLRKGRKRSTGANRHIASGKGDFSFLPNLRCTPSLFRPPFLVLPPSLYFPCRRAAALRLSFFLRATRAPWRRPAAPAGTSLCRSSL